MNESQNSNYRLRKTIGILGILLPILILCVHQKLLSSISHYYYTSASIFFIGILSTFGLVLISYKGYPRNKEKKEKISDDWITTLAGVAILITVLLPTKCSGSGNELGFCGDGYLFGHNNSGVGLVHILSAGIFLFALGLMCIKQFTRNKKKELKLKNSLYRFCGYLVWACILILIILYLVERIFSIDMDNYVYAYTFKLETVAIWAVGIAWLIKGKFDRDLANLKNNLIKRKK